ncbi:MAG: serine hydroxymethyltransferase, partial [Candidatus Thermoplasmatota archaeon]|nr:serine hydroxymethyltransferase [Candidatus Thermoplasmatota archaeon]
TQWFHDSLPLIASENLISPLAREMLITDLHNRYAEGLPGARYYQGNIFVDQIETKAMALARELFKASWADVRPISGTVSNMAALFGLTKPGETIMTPDVASGAHISSAKFGAVGMRGLSSVQYPFDTGIMNIDIDKADKLIRDTKPKLALFGMSVFLFPAPLKDLKDALEETGCYVWYDAAHVLGLIAGGQFQDPLREGAEVMTGSTHKTLPGPQRGILVANPRNEKMQGKLNYAVFPGVSSNHHLHTMASLAITLAEHLTFGQEYAAQTVKNAQALAQALYERDMDVLCPDQGFTKSHTIAVDVRKNGGGTPIVEAMEQANIIANKNLLPWDSVDKALNPSGIRLGVQELTRIGMKESEMVEVAELLKRIIVNHEDIKAVKESVVALKRQYTKVHYCFNVEEGYGYTDLV